MICYTICYLWACAVGGHRCLQASCDPVLQLKVAFRGEGMGVAGCFIGCRHTKGTHAGSGTDIQTDTDKTGGQDRQTDRQTERQTDKTDRRTKSTRVDV